MTFRFICVEKHNHKVARLCRVLRVSRSGYYAWAGRGLSDHAAADIALAAQITAIHTESDGTYGTPRIFRELTAMGIGVSRRRVGRLMRELGLEGVSRRTRRRSTTTSVARPCAPDLVERRFGDVTGPDQLWFADITYVTTWEGFLYVAIVLDAFSRRMIGWSMRDNLEAELVVDALGMAATRRDPRPGTIHHSDRGSQYASTIFGRTLRESGLEQSMGRRGSALDNAVCESAFATLKCELVHRRTFRTRDQAREEIFRWIEGWYNTRRRHSSLGYLSPAEFEQNFHDRQNAEALASDLRPSSSAGKVNTSTDHGPFGPVDPDQPASLGALAGVEPLPTSNRKLSTKVR